MDEILYHGVPILDADTFYTDADGLVWIGTIGNGLLLVDHGKVSAPMGMAFTTTRFSGS